MQKSTRRKETIVTVSAVLLIVLIATTACWHSIGNLFGSGNYAIEQNMVKTIMSKTATPGVAIVSSKQGETEFRCTATPMWNKKSRSLRKHFSNWARPPKRLRL